MVEVESRGRGLPDNSQTIGEQAIPAYYARGNEQRVDSYSYTTDPIDSDGGVVFDLDDTQLVLSTQDEQLWTAISISCLNDDAIHFLRITKQPENKLVFEMTFITSGIFPLDFSIQRPDHARIEIFNLSSGVLSFTGIFSLLTRKKESI